MKKDFNRHFGFLANDVARLYCEQFNRLASESIGITLAQCRALSALATREDRMPISQAQLAARLNLSPMALCGLCDRLEATGWIRRTDSLSDRRVRHVLLAPKTEQALDAALNLSEGLQMRALARLSATERVQLIALLDKVREGLIAMTSEPAQ